MSSCPQVGLLLLNSTRFTHILFDFRQIISRLSLAKWAGFIVVSHQRFLKTQTNVLQGLYLISDMTVFLVMSV